MSFAYPGFLWAFLALLPLAAIYLLKVRPVRKPTTALFLWEEIFHEKKSSALFQRLRDLLSLLMLMIAFAAIVLALARPDFSASDRSDLIILVDNSASMNSTDGGRTRLEQAKTIASQLVRGLRGNQRCSIATFSNETVFVSNFSENPKELLDAIDQIAPTSMVSNVANLDEFAPEELDSKPDETNQEQDTNTRPTGYYRVILISDGCFQDKLPGEIELFKIGDPKVENIGIIAADIQRLPGQGQRAGVFFQVASSNGDPVDADLVLSFNGPDNFVKIVPLTIQPGINSPDVLEIEMAEAGSWYVSLEINDGHDSLQDDNLAYLTLPPARPIPVSIATEDRFFYESSVLAFSRDGGNLKLVSSETGEADPELEIAQGNWPNDDQATTNLLIFNPQGSSPWWEDAGEMIDVNLVVARDETHPVIRHIDVGMIPFSGARRLTAPPGSELLVVAEDDTPLIYQTTRSGRAAIVVNMDPLVSEFYFSTWFPVLIYSSAKHLQGRSRSIPATYRTGQFAYIPGASNDSETKIVAPGERELVSTKPSFGPLEGTGHYRLENESGDWQLSCSLLSDQETLFDGSTTEDNHKPVSRGSSPAAWLTIGAILLITIESILYHRRKVG